MTAPEWCARCGAIGELVDFPAGPEWVHRNGPMNRDCYFFVSPKGEA